MASLSLRLGLLLIPLVFACFALSPTAHAVSPAPDGGYPGGNTAEGQNALFNLTSGGFNTAVGFFALRSNATGQLNTATGAGTLLASTADENTATGAAALLSNTTGSDNTANGAFALFRNTGGSFNTANGDSALSSNTVGAQNTATGFNALQSNTNGSSNTANGAYALVNNITGNDNTANGMFALFSNNTGDDNTATGSQALYSNTTGGDNTANGWQALYSQHHRRRQHGHRLFRAQWQHHRRLQHGLGLCHRNGVTTANNVTCIGAGVAGANVSNTTWIANVYGVATQSGTTAPVVVSDNGQLGTAASSERFKKDIATMEKASEAILSLRPVTFHYKTDTKGTPQFGLIAEEVAKVNPALVLPDKEGKPYTVRYDQVNAMLLNEFLKEHRKNEEQEATIAQLKHDFQSRLADQQKQIEALTTGLQKVSAQLAAASPSRGGLEASKLATGRIRGGGPVPQVVNNP